MAKRGLEKRRVAGTRAALSKKLIPSQTVLVTAATIHPDAVSLLADYRLIYADVRASETELVELCRTEKPSAILVRYGNISEQVIGASPNLRIIAKHGVGTDNIDKSAASLLGIPVTIAAGSNSQAVAEHTLALIFACARKVPWLDCRMREGHWDKDNYEGIELAGATLGLIGAGAIGRKVAEVALVLGMRVLVSDPYAAPANLPGTIELVDLTSLLRASDVVSLHCPLTPETRGLMDAQRLSTLKDGVIVVNTARAALLDEGAMQKELRAGRMCAGLDCFVDEPLGPASSWLSTPNMVMTPHIGGTTGAAFRAMGVGAAHAIVEQLKLIKR